MSENILVLIIIALAFTFIIRKIIKAFSDDEINCICNNKKDCAGCRVFESTYPRLKKKHPETGSNS